MNFPAALSKGRALDATAVKPIVTGSDPFFIAMFQPLDDLIQGHGDGAEDQNGGDQHVKLEETISMKDMDIYLTGQGIKRNLLVHFSIIQNRQSHKQKSVLS